VKRDWIWPAIVVGLLVLGVGANVLLMLYATGDPSFAVEPDYYAKALAWDDHMAQERRNADLGWTIALDLASGPASTGLVGVAATVTDRQGALIEDATVSIEAFSYARGNEKVTAVLPADLPLPRKGLWEFRCTARRGEDVFTAVLREDVP